MAGKGIESSINRPAQRPDRHTLPVSYWWNVSRFLDDRNIRAGLREPFQLLVALRDTYPFHLSIDDARIFGEDAVTLLRGKCKLGNQAIHDIAILFQHFMDEVKKSFEQRQQRDNQRFSAESL